MTCYKLFIILGLCLTTANLHAWHSHDIGEPAVAADPNQPRFIVAIQSSDNELDGEDAIFAYTYTIFMEKLQTSQFCRIDENFGKQQNSDPDIAMNNNHIIAAWTCEDQDDEGIMAKFLDPNIAPVTNDFVVNTNTTGKQHLPAVAIDSHSNSIIVWESQLTDTSTIYARFYDPNIGPLTPEMQISSNSFNPSVAISSDGLATICWSCLNPTSQKFSIAYRQYTPNGNTVSAVTTIAENLHNKPNTCIATNLEGKIVITWDADLSGNSDTDIYARFLDPNNSSSQPKLINTRTEGIQSNPSVAIAKDGSIVIAWQSENADGYDYGICGREYTNNNSAKDIEFPINTYIYGKQYNPDIVINNNVPQFFTIWEETYEQCYEFNPDHIECRDVHNFLYGFSKKHSPAETYSCGDVTGNSFVDMNDLAALAIKWLKWDNIHDELFPDNYPDGFIDFNDFYYIANNWMECCQSPYPPELLPYYHQQLRTNCSFKLRGLGILTVLYMNDNNGRTPASLELLMEVNNSYSEALFPNESFSCPAVCPHTELSDYIYRTSQALDPRAGGDLDDTCPPDMILLYDRQGNHPDNTRCVCFIDSHVETMTEEEFQLAIDKDNEHRRSLGLPELPAE